VFKKARFGRSRTISDGDDAEMPDLSESDIEDRRGGAKHSVPMVSQHPGGGDAEDDAGCDKDNAMLCCKVLFLCLCWYTVSSTNNIIGKSLLTYYPYPATATLFQLLSTALFSQPLAMYWRVPPVRWNLIGWRYYATMIVPLAFGKFIAAVSAHISIWKVPISYAHTVKASMPIFVVFLSRIILRERQTWLVYLSLTPIVTGVIIATLTELSFDITGLLSALLATLAFSLQNVFSKKCLKETRMHHIRLLLVLARISCLLFLPVWLIFDVRYVLSNWDSMAGTDWTWVVGLLLLDGFLNFAQNVIAFTMIALVTPLSYAVANASKRIAVILMSLVILQNPVTTANCVGMGMAILGVLLYNKAKYDQNREAQRIKLLPYVKSDADMINNDPSALHASPSMVIPVMTLEAESRAAKNGSVFRGHQSDQQRRGDGHPPYRYV
ncbi:hypothetical protein BOX15_Mlig029801g1, partial [Macrostomum lignano]